MKKRSPLFALLLILLVACGRQRGNSPTSPPTAVLPTHTPPPTDTPLPTAVPDSAFTHLVAGWNKIEPGGDTRCAHDTPFSYWVKPGNVNKLLIYFEGGGGCWDAQTCKQGSTFYDADVGPDEDPTNRRGIFDLDNPANPFRDYHAVYIPSCNGDVYWGNSVQNYPKEDGSALQIYHRGFVNAGAALGWAYQNIPDPDAIFVTGCSAGSVGSRVHTPYIIEQYPTVPVTQFGDSLAFVFGRQFGLGDPSAYPSWIPELTSLEREGGALMAEYDSIIANHYPDTTFAQYNTKNDNVQERFYTAVSGLPTAGFQEDLTTHLMTIHAAAPNFRSFTPAGELHCILPRSQFYSAETGGVSLVEWVAALANGEDVPNVQCKECQTDFGLDAPN
ncbi:MAG: pectinesterase [Chloroflexi bacterium]|nr:pectinesterase [Chloroflexota bacterium]